MKNNNEDDDIKKKEKKKKRKQLQQQQLKFFAVMSAKQRVTKYLIFPGVNADTLQKTSHNHLLTHSLRSFAYSRCSIQSHVIIYIVKRKGN